MTTPEDGGPAFPPQVVRAPDGALHEVSAYGMQSGMTLRDYFALGALSGLVVNGTKFDLPRLAGYSYEMADAMLIARKS